MHLMRVDIALIWQYTDPDAAVGILLGAVGIAIIFATLIALFFMKDKDEY